MAAQASPHARAFRAGGGDSARGLPLSGTDLPDGVVTGLGGHGVAAVYEGAEPGPTVLIRAELDGLPIEETSTFAHRSQVRGKGHLCGHDGHMTMVAALGRGLQRRPLRRGRAVLMFQPAEEDVPAPRR